MSKYEREIKLYPILNGRHCARFLKQTHEEGDSMSYFVIIPRQAVLDYVRRSVPWKSYKRWEMHPALDLAFNEQLVHPYSYSGPGRWFWHGPGIYKSTKNYFTLYQHGGLDI